MASFSVADARRFYDRMGRKQDSQTFYEEPAIDVLRRRGAWREATDVLELGCGTGRVARALLDGELAPNCRYTALDVSETMCAIARERLRPWSGRAKVLRHDGAVLLPFEDESFDRYLATYVYDLFEPAQIVGSLAEAHRVLRPGGLLCLVGLGPGVGLVSKLIAAGWSAIRRVRPAWVGGCRPLDITAFLDGDSWRVAHRQTVTPYGIASQAVVAQRV